MATVVKDFKIKNGLIVEGSSGTINSYDILTKSPADQTYIIGLIGGAATPDATPDTVVLRDENADFSANMITADLTGDVTGTVSSLSNHNTDDLAEGTNQYFTDARAKTSAANLLTTATLTNITITGNGSGLTITAENGVADSTTDDLDEGSTNKYYTDQRVDDYINNFIDTDDVSEGTSNLYYTDTRVRNAVSDGDGLNYNSGTGVFSAHLGNGLEIGAGGEIQIDDTVVATETDLSGAITAHDVASGVHGITGNVVGTTDTQTLSNKSLGSNLDAGTYKITNLGAPSNSTDAATKAYVDAVSEGLHVHQAAKVYVASNINLSTQLEAGDIIDGVTLVAGDRVLVKNQSTTSQNGIYVAVTSGVAVRASDFDTPAEIDGGDFTFITGGTINDNTGWVQTEKVTTIGTDPIIFTQFSGAGTYSAGNGLTLTGSQFSINTAVTVDLSTAQTLTNKTLALGSNTISGTIAQFNTALTDADFATLAGSETFSNKTLTGPIISGLTLSDSSIVFEGSSADEFETTLTVTNPTADRTITFPNATGTVALEGYLPSSLTWGDLKNGKSA